MKKLLALVLFVAATVSSGASAFGWWGSCCDTCETMYMSDSSSDDCGCCW